MTEFSAELVAADGSRLNLGGEQRVGRSADCDITIDDPRISRAHAILRVAEGRLTVEDLGSANGTQVNGIAVSGETGLGDGDTLTFDKHSFVVVLANGGGDDDATVVGRADADATVVSAPEPEPEPEPRAQPQAEPAPGPSDLPGSWIDSGTSDSTRVLSLDAIAESESERVSIDRASDLPHLILLSASGQGGEALELQPGAGSEPDVWEIGRDPACEIAIDEPSVSARHAQLIHQDGRWRLVNLVSANGIFVNGEKRLTAYLADGDEVRLGVATLVFRAAVGGAVPASPEQPASAESVSGSGASSALVRNLVIAGAVALVAAALYYFIA